MDEKEEFKHKRKRGRKEREDISTSRGNGKALALWSPTAQGSQGQRQLGQSSSTALRENAEGLSWDKCDWQIQRTGIG